MTDTARQIIIDDLSRFTNTNTLRVLEDISIAYIKQNLKWWAEKPVRNFEWLALLGKEVGDVNRYILDLWLAEADDYAKLRQKLIQVAAIAVRFIESLDQLMKTEN